MLFIVHNPCLYSCHAWRNNNSVEWLRYRRPRRTYLLADWSRYATSFSPSSNHRPSGNMTASATRIFRDRYCSVLKCNAQIFVADRLCYVTPNSHRPTRHDKTVVSASRRVCELDSRWLKTVADGNFRVWTRSLQRSSSHRPIRHDPTRQNSFVASGRAQWTEH